MNGAFVAIVIATAMFGPSRAAAAPDASLIVVWAPDLDVAPIAAVARRHRAAMIDRSPTTITPAIDVTIQRGIDAYESLQLDSAWSHFEEARRQLDATGGAGVTNARLSDLFVYRGLLRTQQGNADAAWEELVAAMIVAPARVFDPARFSPRTLADLERARGAATTRVTLVIDAPSTCAITLDGISTTAHEASILRGVHWLHARCPGAAPWGRRIEVAETTARVTITPAPLSPPSETDLRVQARTAGGLVVVEVRGTIGVVRLLGLDGNERDRRSTTIVERSPRALSPVATIVGELLAPRTRPKWYQSRWAWAAGGALALAAVLIPIAIVVSDDQPTGVSVRGPGDLP